jgi:hypothetical protein
MKARIACWLLLCTRISAAGGEASFATVLDRVSQRDPITRAILAVDQNREFKLEIIGDQARVTIWTNMKVRDPQEETLLFPLSDDVRQEHARLQFQGELDRLRARCLESEQRFRVSQYKKHSIQYGMPYAEAKERLRDEFRPGGGLAAEAGRHVLESDTHLLEFRQGVLVDVLARNAPDKQRADGKP